VRAAAFGVIALLVAPSAWAQREAAAAPPALLARVAAYVERYYARALTIVSRETVHLQPVDRALTPVGHGRLLVYELRVEWSPAAARPALSRRLLKSSGRLTPRQDETECLDPKDASLQPMAMLLPVRQQAFAFTQAGTDGDRPHVVMLDFTPRSREHPTVAWNGPCGTIELNGSTRGRIWVEAPTGVVLRVDEWLHKPFQFVSPANALRGRGPVSQTIDRLETSVRYEPVTFRDPHETLMLPKSVRTLAVIHNGGVPRLLTLQTFDDYRRFITEGRVVK
jgi:hypothetical protein